MEKVVTRDPEILGGEPVFAGTRVNVADEKSALTCTSVAGRSQFLPGRLFLYRPDPFSSALPLLWEATVNNLMIIIDRSVST